VAPSFVAGVVFKTNIVCEAAPVVYYMEKEKWTRKQVLMYIKKRGWTI
jgi:hypothetical protein